MKFSIFVLLCSSGIAMKDNFESIYYVVSSIILPISVIVAIITLCFSNHSLKKQLKQSNDSLLKQLQHDSDLQKKQAQETFFSEYTRRYQEIILHMPTDNNHPEWLKYVQLYFDLCSEEFHLHQMGLIDDTVWSLWVDGMRDTMKPISYKLAWQNHLGQLYSDKNFIYFMDNTIMNYGNN